MKETFKKLKIHKSWFNIFTPFFKSDDIVNIKRTLLNVPFAPIEVDIFKAFSLPLSDIKVVILGQDPYPTAGMATGLAFAVPNDKKRPPSLKKIMELIRTTVSSQPVTFDVDEPFDTTLEHLHQQGVFLLNTALTVRLGYPDSHVELWQPFINTVIKTLSEIDYLIWALWGKSAQSFIPLINDNHAVLTAARPMAENHNPKVLNKFSESDHFKQINELLKKNKKRIITWDEKEKR